jgi:hypothetical protein
MAVAGRKPKPAGETVHRNKPVHEWTEVEDVPFGDGPGLPDARSDGRPWPRRTRQKWEAWRSMPHAKLWGPAEWDYALDCIEVAAKFHEGDFKQATELRNREKVLGTTLDFRRDLRIRYVEPQEQKLASVVNADDFRKL